MTQFKSARASTCLAALLTTMVVLLAGIGDAQAQRRGGDGFLKAGTTGTRFGLGAFLLKTVERDEAGNVTGEDSGLGVSVLAGLSYAVFTRLAVDMEAEFSFALQPELDLFQIELIPAARLFILPELYGRAAYAVRLKEPTNQLFLLGGGYIVRGRSVSVYIELNVVVQSQKPVDSPIIPRIGLELAF